MARKGRVLNIEISDRIIKVCESALHGKSVQIAQSALFITPEGAVSDGVITNPEAMGKHLGELLREKGFAASLPVVFTLTSGKVATREVKLPPVKDNRLRDIVRANASDYFPVDISRYHIAHVLLSREEKGEDAGCRVLVMAVPMDLLDGYFKLAAAAELNIQDIDYSGNSQFHALRSFGGDEVCMYVNVDCDHSMVTVLRGGEYLLQRSFSFGGDDLIQGYMAAAGDRAGDYLDAMEACSVPQNELLAGGVLTEDALHEGLQRVVSNIARSYDYFNSNHWEHPVEKLVLTGSCGHLAGLRELVAGIGAPTFFLEELPEIGSLSNAAKSITTYISCIGSNLDPLDLIPPEYREKNRKKRAAAAGGDSLRPAVLLVCGVLVLCIALCLTAFFRYMNAAAARDDLQQQISSLAYTKDVYNNYVAIQQSASDLTAFDEAIGSPNDQLKALIGELEQKMPSGILLLSVSCTRTDISMNVTVPDFDTAATVLAQLRSFSSIRSVSVTQMAEETDETGATHVSFSLVCTYGDNPYLANADPYGDTAAMAAAKAAAASSGSDAAASSSSAAGADAAAAASAAN